MSPVNRFRARLSVGKAQQSPVSFRTSLNAVTACAALSLLLASLPASAQVEWTIASGGNGHFYLPVSVPSGISWSDSNSAATLAGGYLATITSQQENNFAFSLIDQPQFWVEAVNHGIWLGGLQPDGSPEPGGGFQWVTGEAFAYTGWYESEPNNASGNEDHIQYFGGIGVRIAAWNDLNQNNFTKAPGYFIEFNSNPAVVPEAGTLALFGAAVVPIAALVVRRRRPVA